ncbi:MAG: glycosyltransferase [Terriglobia bacterium]
MPETVVISISENQRQQALRLFAEGKYEQAAGFLAEALKNGESSELWNDWATATLMCNQAEHSEQGYRRALDLDPRSSRAAGNLGILLASKDRFTEALPLLERGANGSIGSERRQLLQVIELCRTKGVDVSGNTNSRHPQTAQTAQITQMAGVINLQSQAIAGIAKRLSAIESSGLAGVPSFAAQAPAQIRPPAVAQPPSPFQNTAGLIDLNHAYLYSFKDGRPALAMCNERIVEIPFVHRHLPYPFEGRVLDVGSRESQMAFELSCLGFESWALDIREVRAAFPGVKHLRADIRSTPFESKSFDVVIALSTLEHIGLVAYGNVDYDEEGDVHALEEIHRILKPEKKLLLTVPFGVRGKADAYRVYDHDALLGWLAQCGFEVEKEDYWRQSGLPWSPAHWSEAEMTDSLANGAKAVACIVARRGAAGTQRKPKQAQISRHESSSQGASSEGSQSAQISPIGKTSGTNGEATHPRRPERAAAEGAAAAVAQQASPQAKILPGVLFRGLIYGGSGYGEENWMEALGLTNHQIPVQLLPLGESFDEKGLLPGPSRQKLKSLQRQLVDLPKSVIYQASPANAWDLDLSGRYRVGRTMFETDRIPLGFLDRCNAMDEVWLPSRFNMETFAASGVDERKLRLVPPGVDIELFRPGSNPLPIPQKRGFNFLSIFDWQMRKGYDALLRAYLREFKPDDDVALILKVSQMNDTARDLEAEINFFIEREVGVPLQKTPPIILIKQFSPQAEMSALYAAADCFVLPTRGEGYGRPYLEALACQLPVIATNWSGQMDFLNAGNSYLIESKLTTVPKTIDLELFMGHRWAEPDHEHLSHLMREVLSGREEAARKADRGRQDMLRDYDWSVVIPRWVNEFERLLN